MPTGGSYYKREIPFNGIINKTWDDIEIKAFIRAMFFPPFVGALYKYQNKYYECTSMQSYRRLKRTLN